MNRESASVRVRRALLFSLGILCTTLAIVGVIVPGLPSTVFVIAASYLFAKSSPEWERRLRANRWLGASLQQFEETGGMPRKSKAIALAAMWGGLAVSWVMLAAAPLLQVATLVLGIVGTGTLLFVVRTTAGG